MIEKIERSLVPIKSNHHDDEFDGSTGVLTKPESKTQTPSMYKVVLLNDDFTPMDFVVHVLEKFFKKSANEATSVMLQVHNEGAGIAGVYSFEIAETKSFQVNEYAKSKNYPLKSSVEKA